MTYSDAQKYNNVHTLADVMVIEKHNDSDYKLQTDQGQVFEASFCSDTVVDFSPGTKLKLLNYEQRKGCKSLHGKNLGFLAYTDSAGNRLNFFQENTHE